MMLPIQAKAIVNFIKWVRKTSMKEQREIDDAKIMCRIEEAEMWRKNYENMSRKITEVQNIVLFGKKGGD